MSTLHDRRAARRAADLCATRARLEAAVEAAIAALDAFDGDPDAEPSLGSGAAQPWTSQRTWAAGSADDREEECEDEGAQCEDEGAVTGDDELSLCGVTYSFHGAETEGTSPEWGAA